MTPANDPLLQPFQLRHLTIRNRIMSTSHAPAYADDSMPAERYQRYHEEKARGGIGLSMFGGSSNVSADSPSVFGNLWAGDDRIIPFFQDFTRRMHDHGAALMCQLTHMGRRSHWNVGNWVSNIAPSRLREPAHRSFPRQADEADLERVIDDFGEAARRCQEGGLDGLELNAHNHLLGQFLSPATNFRDDRYGGAVENRIRLLLEVLARIRARVGADFIVGLRVAADERLKDGLAFGDCLDIVKRVEATGMADFVNLNVGHVDTDRALAESIPGMISGLAPHLQLVKRLKAETGLPVFHACRIIDLATARHAVTEDVMDLVALTRAHLADPHIAAKLASGREDRIRSCVGAGYCLDRIYEGGEALCIQNAATGRERTLPHTIEPTAGRKRKVVVVGGGPAGMEAARVSASRGHDVVLFEASDRLGGQIVLAAKAGWRKELAGIARWLQSELDILGVDIRTNTFAEDADVLAENPDVVIVATGGIPDTEFVDGGEHCASVWDILSASTPAAGDVLVYDDNGQHQGPSCADYLADTGATVELVTPDRTVVAEMGGMNFTVYMKHFYAKGVTMTTDQRLVSVTPDGNRLACTFKNEWTDALTERTVDQVVLEHGTLPMDQVFHDLRAKSANNGITDLAAIAADAPQPALADLGTGGDGSFALYRVGDADSSRNIHAALLDSLRICKDI